MTEEQYTELYKILLQIQETIDKRLQVTVDHIESDLIDDRSNLEKIINKLDSVKSLQDTLQSRIPNVENKMKDAVSEAVSEAVQPVIDNTQKVIDSKVIVLTKKHPLWLKFLPFLKYG